jgi:hypothetical protein
MIWAAIIAGVASVASASVGYVNHRRIREIHVLVNNRLDAALEKIASLQSELKGL